jgi:hypothetical protein
LPLLLLGWIALLSACLMPEPPIDESALKDDLKFTGSVYGKVVDEWGNPLPSVQITLTNEDPAQGGYSTNSDPLGNYTLPDVRAGIYTLIFSKAEYMTKSVPLNDFAEDEDRNIEGSVELLWDLSTAEATISPGPIVIDHRRPSPVMVKTFGTTVLTVADSMVVRGIGISFSNTGHIGKGADIQLEYVSGGSGVIMTIDTGAVINVTEQCHQNLTYVLKASSSLSCATSEVDVLFDHHKVVSLEPGAVYIGP